MLVDRFPHDPGPAAWNAILPQAQQRNPLREKRTADWLVIGAGFAGLSAARRLGELHPNDSIVVLEASRIAEGPSGRNSGFMIDVPHDLTSDDYGGTRDKDLRDIRLNRAGIAYALDAKTTFDLSDETIASSGKVNGAITQRGINHNKAYAQHLDRLKEPYEKLDADGMNALTGMTCYVDGLFIPGTVMIQPALYIRALASAIETARLELYEQSPVIELNRLGQLWNAKTPSGTVTAPKVLLCVNGHLESFGFFKQHLVHVFTYASMTRRLTPRESKILGGQAIWAMTPADPLGTTVRRISGTGGDRLIIRNRATFDPKLCVDKSRIRTVARDHDRSFSFRFPMLGNIEMDYRWGGRLCLSRNNVPVFGEIETNLYAACCQNGLGTAKGTVSGKLAAELATDLPSSLLDDQQADVAPQKLPLAPIAALGATFRLRWGEFRAGKEL